MTVDIKTLRVGSHVNLCGKRQHIVAIDALNGAIGMCGYLTDENGVKHPLGYKVEDIEPINITPELLTELGFGHILNTDMWTLKCDRTVQIGRISDKVWTITKYLCQFSLIERCTVRYLHEAEAFLALHGVELINE